MWEWLSGKKTVIGSVLLWIAAVAIPFVAEQGFDPSWMGFVASAFTWIAGILIPIGVGHKIKKA